MRAERRVSSSTAALVRKGHNRGGQHSTSPRGCARYRFLATMDAIHRDQAPQLRRQSILEISPSVANRCNPTLRYLRNHLNSISFVLVTQARRGTEFDMDEDETEGSQGEYRK